MGGRRYKGKRDIVSREKPTSRLEKLTRKNIKCRENKEANKNGLVNDERMTITAVISKLRESPGKWKWTEKATLVAGSRWWVSGGVRKWAYGQEERKSLFGQKR